MAKQVVMWKSEEEGELFDTQEEAEEADAESKLSALVYGLNQTELDIIHKILDNAEFAKAFVHYGNMRKKANAVRAKENDRSDETMS